MQTTLEQFYSDYRIKNNYAPNETVLNTGLLRLKREIRELNSKIAILANQPIEEYNPNKIYEVSEFVQYKGEYYESLHDDNCANDPQSVNTSWKVADFWLKADDSTQYQDFYHLTWVAEPNQAKFVVDNRNLEGIPAVFVDGILVDHNQFTYENFTIKFITGLEANQVVIAIFGICYDTGIVSPSIEMQALSGQTKFTTTFDLISPHVHVNGVLVSRNNFEYGKNWVDLNYPCRKGDTVVITNGSTIGLDDYFTKGEIQKLIDNIYTKDETYNRDEIDTKVNDLEEKIYTDDNIVKLNQVYIKGEIDAFLDTKVDEETFEQELSKKPDKGDSLAHYGIADAYTKYEEDALLLKKLDKDEFTTQAILDRLGDSDALQGLVLDAKTLDGKPASDYYLKTEHQDVFEGLSISSNTIPYAMSLDYDTNLAMPHYSVTRRPKQFDEISGKVFHSFNSSDLIIRASGNFNGTFETDLHNLGILDPSQYTWQVQVIPINVPRSLKFDFMPKGYGSGFNFKAFYENTEVQSSHFYGFVTNGVMHCYAYAEISGNIMRKWQAQYLLVGYAKSLCTEITYNQGQTPLSYARYPWQDKESFELAKNQNVQLGDITSDDVMSANAFTFIHNNSLEEHSTMTYQAPAKARFSPKLLAESDIILDNAQCEFVLVNGMPNAAFELTINGHAEINLSEKQKYFDDRGECYFKVNCMQAIGNDESATLLFRASGHDEIKKTLTLRHAKETSEQP